MTSSRGLIATALPRGFLLICCPQNPRIRAPREELCEGSLDRGKWKLPECVLTLGCSVMMMHACHPDTQGTEAEAWVWKQAEGWWCVLQ